MSHKVCDFIWLGKQSTKADIISMQGNLSFKNWLTILQDDGNSVLVAFKQRHCDDIIFTQFSFIQAYVWND